MQAATAVRALPSTIFIEFYHEHLLFSEDSKSLQVLFYTDDIEICNLLGSRAKRIILLAFTTCASCPEYVLHNYNHVTNIWTHSCFHMFTAMFYYLLGNIRPRYQSQLKAIQLVVIVNTSVIDSNDIDAALTPFIDDIKKLEMVTMYTFLC